MPLGLSLRLLVKHDGQVLVRSVDDEATLSVAFTLSPRAQFDQAGAMVLVDETCWVPRQL